MNILNILEEVEKVDGEIYERLNPRRKAMKDFYGVGKKVAMAAVPLALGSMFTKAYGQTTPAQVKDVLGFALALEYLEWNYYNHAVEKLPGLIESDGMAAIKVIRDHERMHVDFLKGALKITGPDQYVYADFDFTAGGTFSDVDSNYLTFLKVALAFEDTGVRAYKGQAPNLLKDPNLTYALQIHAVEARHAAHIRGMLAAKGAPLAPWISLGPNGESNDTGVAAANMTYAGEDNETQLGIKITGISGINGITKAKAVECFDEALTKAQVIEIANGFIKPGKKLS
ncbi:hypothetical protein ABIB40_001810 [Pedobacter sp. UYP30]|uniref:ferritin-like domain-containing protein n=1 Tax=Pedobacter sp. UYP30 TaxID=1756400 RepID=UPI00339B8EE8